MIQWRHLANRTPPVQAGSSQAAQAASLFDRFAAAFATFDAENLLPLFATPGVVLRQDSTTIALTTQDDIRRYYQTALDRYRNDGCHSCNWTDLHVTPMGNASMLASVTWDLRRADRTSMLRWRQSYSLCSTHDGPRIFASARHAE